jgi:hypothetical protein
VAAAVTATMTSAVTSAVTATMAAAARHRICRHSECCRYRRHESEFP